MSLRDIIYDKFRDAILRWDESLAQGIYAISFFVYDEDDDPRRPTLTLGHNTIEHWRRSIPKASDENEAKWNYAFWPHTTEAYFGEPCDELPREEWIKSLGLWYEDSEDDEEIDRAYEIGEKITREFVELAVEVSRRLHEEGVIRAKFGKDIPILVHELEYYEEIARQTERANPVGAAEEFVAWVSADYQ